MTGSVVVAPHPDDEVLGCAAVLASGPVTVVHVSDGVPPWVTAPTEVTGLRARRMDECRAAWASIGARVVDNPSFGLPDLGVHTALAAVVDGLVGVLEEQPDATVYVPAYQRGHPDHDAVYVASQLARRILEGGPGAAGRWRWLAYGLYGLDEDMATRFGWLPADYYGPSSPACTSADELAAKAGALRCFPSQLRPDSVVQRWLDRPQGEAVAPLPDPGRGLPDLAAYYTREMDLSSHGIVLDDRIDGALRSAFADASARRPQESVVEGATGGTG